MSTQSGHRVQKPHRKTRKGTRASQQQLATSVTESEQVSSPPSSPVVKVESPPLPSPSDFALPSFPTFLSQVHAETNSQRPMAPRIPYYYHHPDFGIEAFMIYYHPP